MKAHRGERSDPCRIGEITSVEYYPPNIALALRKQRLFHRSQKNNYMEGVLMVGMYWISWPRPLRVLHGPRERGYGMRHPLSLAGGAR